VADAWAAHSSVPAEVTADAGIGRLEAGRRADLIVLTHDPLAPGAAMPTTVGATMVDGDVVHDPHGWLA
jgi:imidazolonepropionase-like amidohydrolase